MDSGLQLLEGNLQYTLLLLIPSNDNEDGDISEYLQYTLLLLIRF